MTDHDFLMWLSDRLTEVYHESPNVDFVQKLKKIAKTHKRYDAVIDVLVNHKCIAIAPGCICCSRIAKKISEIPE
jgi:hypothetical protein